MKPRKKSLDSNMNVMELAQHLRQEHLFIQSEKKQIQKLNIKVSQASDRLFHLAWIIRQQRINLNRLNANNEKVDPATCTFLASAFESVSFVDSHKKLGALDPTYSNLLYSLRRNPTLLAKCFAEDASSAHDLHTITQVVLSALYGDCLIAEDRILMLNLLKELITLQVAAADNPCRLLARGTCAFSRLYKMFSESMSSAKLFLISVLHDPVVCVLADDDLYLHPDTESLLMKVPAAEQQRYFGDKSAPAYKDNIEKYKRQAQEKLTVLLMKFVDSIRSNFFCFPENLCWLVKQLYMSLTEAKKVDRKEAAALCTDLVFDHFICSAILRPDRYGIIDMHISPAAKDNLEQIAHLIQLLARNQLEQHQKFSALFDKVKHDCLSTLMDSFLTQEPHATGPSEFNLTLKDITRKCILITEPHLHAFIEFLHAINTSTANGELSQALTEILGNIPRMPKHTGPISDRLSNNSSTSGDGGDTGNDRRSKSSLLNRVAKRMESQLEAANLINFEDNSASEARRKSPQTQFSSEVIVIPIANASDNLLPGMATEEKILELELQKRQTKVRMNLEANAINDELESVVSGSASENAIEKRTSFSQDQESVGTCDNLEVISEASNHSVSSSMDMEENENEGDNLSDMVSANVSSGRGTPNVSGRETPSSRSSQSSHSDNNEEDNNNVPVVVQVVQNHVVQAPPQPPTPTQVSLNAIPVEPPNRSGNQNDIEEKFGKFPNFKSSQSAPDETKSLLSDTWSTDVIGSDSEAFEQQEANAAMQAANAINFITHQAQQQGANNVVMMNPFEAVETASQSDAWSTDALTSDTERLQEFDPDETSSVRSSTRSVDNQDNVHHPPQPPIAAAAPPPLAPAEPVKPAQASASNPLAATGAIPKNFNRRNSNSRSPLKKDAHDHDDQPRHHNRKSFFKIPNIKSKVTEKIKSLKDGKRTSTHSTEATPQFNGHDQAAAPALPIPNYQAESVDEILEKYRAKRTAAANLMDEPVSDSTAVLNEETFAEFRSDLAAALSVTDKVAIFNNTKRKLRRVLSLVDVQSLPFFAHEETFEQANGIRVKTDVELVKFLKVLFAEAKHLQNSSQVVVLQETIRCVESLDEKACQQLFWSLREDYRRRSPYISYLVKSRQNLLTTLAHFEGLLEHLYQDQTICAHNLITSCVRQYLEGFETILEEFDRTFQTLSAADEKQQLVDRQLTELYKAMDSQAVWQVANEEQLEYARNVIERAIFSRIYSYALYPNGDGDILRDQVLHEHMSKLAEIITPAHKDLRIPAIYNSECPWTAAQEEVLTLNAYKTPREKVACISRTCNIIMGLLRLASDRAVPAADDLFPVLIFVLIKANPVALLSTVQFVNSFFQKYFEGEESYWWSQFCSVVEFIKTMDY